MTTRRLGIAMSASVLNIGTAIFNNFFFLRAVALGVPKDELGSYLFLASVVGYVGLAQAGMDLAAAQQIAESVGKNEYTAANRIFYQLGLYNRFISGVLAAAVLGFVLWSYVQGDASYRDTSLVVVTLVSSIILRLWCNPNIAALSGGQHFHISSIASLGNAFASVLIGYLLFLGGLGVLSIALGQLISGFGNYLFLRHQRAARCLWSLEPVQNGRQDLGKLVKFGLLVSGVALLNMIDAGSDPILFRLFTGAHAENTADFNMWARMPLLSIALLSVIANNSSALLTARLQQDRPAGLVFHNKIFLATSCLGALALISVAIWLTPFMHFWLKGEFDQEFGWHCSVALGLMVFFRTIQSSGIFVFYALQMGRIVLISSVIQVSAKWLIAPWLISQEPVLGCAIASAASTGLGAIFAVWRLCCLSGYPRRNFLIAAAYGTSAFCLATFIAPLVTSVSLPQLLTGVALTLAITGIPALFLLQRARVQAIA